MLALELSTGCTGAQQADDSGALTAKADPYDRLYQAIEGEVAARGWPVAVASPRYRTLTTEYEAAGQALRKRRTMRVVMLPRGGALRVVVEYERQVTGPDGQPVWEAAAESSMLERAREEELEIGRAIERRFHRLR
jgi:hypothetical protein